MTDLEIFHHAPDDATPEQLAAYLDEACGDDAELRARVEGLFAMSAKAESFLEEPFPDPAMPNGLLRGEMLRAIVRLARNRAVFRD